ncbi:hypothetical protein F66182_5960 [Fusarium sp. NRRL 66182]|nr:hypothetical protein F66182_5960 [Fusarium sp. NRRL 66182]
MSSPANHSTPRPPGPALPPPQPGASGAGSAAPPDPSSASPRGRGLPDRSVSEDSVEDAYVDFILYCNPAVPLSADTASLREAFRNPPRSGGKSFNTFAIYELVRKFYSNDIRTWTELTTKLGVEPPDPDKEESNQKVAQYGVRLKKWMNSMHVKAFFEYLMDIPNDYWTAIPTDSNPTSQPIRDGVAMEDDMALRALFPHIRPKRGRKRPADQDTATSTSQRCRLAPSSAADGVSGPLSADPSRLGGAPWTPSEGVQQTLLFRWPQSAITPTTRTSFWDDALEPQSAATPSKPRPTAQRRGPKNVSSAWRPGVPNGGVKPRGRPPMNRTPVDVSLPSFSAGTAVTASEEPVSRIYSPSVPALSAVDGEQPEESISAPVIAPQPRSTPPRPSRPNISLRVPERPSGSVRLATPPPRPPAVTVNGQPSNSQPPSSHTAYVNTPTSVVRTSHEAAVPRHHEVEEPMSQPKSIPRLYFERLEDRTNVDEVIGYMMRCAFESDWVDLDGNPTRTCSMHEAMVIVNCVIEDMYKTATSPEAFLINLAAVTGGGHLLAGTTRITRLGVTNGVMKYDCEWHYGFGHFRGQYQMEMSVPLDMLQEPEENQESTSEASERKLSADEWQAKYEKLLTEMEKKDQKFLDLRTKVTSLLRGGARKE